MYFFDGYVTIFYPSRFDILAQWVTSEALLLQFSATTFPYPLRYTDIAAYQILNPDNRFYIASDSQLGDYGFAEIIPQADNVPRLGRLLIGKPELRGKGLGKQMIRLLLNECRTTYYATAAELYVLTDNLAGIKCYQGIGFVFIDDGTEINLSGTVKTMWKMRLEL